MTSLIHFIFHPSISSMRISSLLEDGYLNKHLTAFNFFLLTLQSGDNRSCYVHTQLTKQ